MASGASIHATGGELVVAAPDTTFAPAQPGVLLQTRQGDAGAEARTLPPQGDENSEQQIAQDSAGSSSSVGQVVEPPGIVGATGTADGGPPPASAADTSETGPPGAPKRSRTSSPGSSSGRQQLEPSPGSGPRQKRTLEWGEAEDHLEWVGPALNIVSPLTDGSRSTGPVPAVQQAPQLPPAEGSTTLPDAPRLVHSPPTSGRSGKSWAGPAANKGSVRGPGSSRR
ncbi:unnamed protein product [Amoebophrya sp. A120]|nr:unnamed protein product [Amoebophrya sp. A120]|eukprot:GSA120T00019710001.1